MPRRHWTDPVPETLELEEFKTMLEKKVEEWNRELREEGRLLGLEEGRQEWGAEILLQLLEQKFGQLDPKTRSRVRRADAKRLLAWGKRVLAAGRLEDVFEN